MIRTTSICTSLLYNYLLSDSDTVDNDGKQLGKKAQKLRCLSDTLQSYGGVLSKLSQMLLLDNQNSNVFSDCEPYSRDKTINFFKKFIDGNTSSDLKHVDFSVYKSGSIGQVHKAMYKNKSIVFKVQYVGLAEQTQTDLNMLDTITSYLYYFSDMKNAMVDIKTTMYDELDYKMEAKNQILMRKLYKDSKYIEIPEIIPSLCTNKVLGMYFVKGKSLRDFISNSSQTEKNKIGMCIVKFIFGNIYKHGILYSDAHYGNFLVKDNSTLCVLDFGCLHYLNKELHKNMCDLHISIRNKDKKLFLALVEKLGIIDKNISRESCEYMYKYFCIQYEPWTSDNFEFTEKWLDMATEKNTELMKEWTLPQNMVYMNKIPYGLFHVLTKLKLKGNFLKVFDEMLGK
jgi:predicted unusual protein kinase regulating ubiquinone biosynthesis (AarF/ABC1/UbiB family)